MIKVTTDPARKLVIAHMSGFLSPADVESFSLDEQHAVESMGLASGEFLLLVNTSEAIIQPQEVVLAFQRLITDAKYKARRNRGRSRKLAHPDADAAHRQDPRQCRGVRTDR